MQTAIVIPGIMGSRLYLPDAGGAPGTEVWPPRPSEVAFGYNRIAELQRPDLIVGPPIDKVLCFNFYDLLDGHLARLGFSAGSATKRQVDFPYDWRRDNFDTADKLAARIAEVVADGATEVFLLAHSMGGLISRLVLESGKFDAEPWFGRITLFAAMGTPHLGAPLALARIFGLDSASGISRQDFRTLAANRDYPSGYQLIPAPGEAAIWNLDSPDVAPLDPYDAATGADLGLDPVLIARARAQYDTLAAGSRPGHVRYVWFAGSGHRTATRVNVRHTAGQPTDHTRSVVTRTEGGGDGTVPMYSALPTRGQRQIVVNEHATVFKGLPFAKVFFRLLGGDAGTPVEATPGVPRGDGLRLHLSLDAPVYDRGQIPELVLSLIDPGTDTGVGLAAAIDGEVVITPVNEAQEPAGDVHRVPVAYAGPPVSSLTLMIAEALEPGLYSLSFEGSPAPEAALAFAMRQG